MSDERDTTQVLPVGKSRWSGAGPNPVAAPHNDAAPAGKDRLRLDYGFEQHTREVVAPPPVAPPKRSGGRTAAVTLSALLLLGTGGVAAVNALGDEPAPRIDTGAGTITVTRTPKSTSVSKTKTKSTWKRPTKSKTKTTSKTSKTSTAPAPEPAPAPTTTQAPPPVTVTQTQTPTTTQAPAPAPAPAPVTKKTTQAPAANPPALTGFSCSRSGTSISASASVNTYGKGGTAVFRIGSLTLTRSLGTYDSSVSASANFPGGGAQACSVTVSNSLGSSSRSTNSG